MFIQKCVQISHILENLNAHDAYGLLEIVKDQIRNKRDMPIMRALAHEVVKDEKESGK